VSKKPPRASNAQIGESSDSDAPIGKKLAVKKQQIEKQAEKEAVAIRKEEKKAKAAPAKKKAKAKDSGDDVDVAKGRRKSTAKAAASKKSNGIKAESSDDDIPLARKAGPSKTNKKVKSETSTPVKKAKAETVKKEEAAEDDEEGEEETRWWDNPMANDGTKKWDTLEHSGDVFPPPYEPLPKNVKMLYDGKPVSMHPDAEEVAGFFGGMLNSTHNVENPTFQKNFFHDFKDILKKTGGATDSSGQKVDIKEFSKCDFRPIFQYYDAQREAKKALPAAEKKALKAAKDAVEAPYMYCVWDGRKQKVGNFRVEPPGLFRGRGEHPAPRRVPRHRAPPATACRAPRGEPAAACCYPPVVHRCLVHRCLVVTVWPRP